jgi:putative tryptophan/tyrosine transport system substrate-binding protein
MGRVNRRTFLLAVGVLATARHVGAQTPQKIYRVAHLSTAGRTPDGAPPRALREGLRELGYIEGQNVVYTARFAEGKVDRLPGLATELLNLGADVIVTQGRPAVVAAKDATSTTPIVIAPASSDAVATGLINSLPRPGGNVTGLSDELAQLSAKRMQLLTETVPKAGRIAILWNSTDPGMLHRYRAIANAAHVLKVEVYSLALQSPEDFEPAFATMMQRRPDALFLVTDALTNMNQRRVIEFAAAQRLPAMYESNLVVNQGGLMSYGPTGEHMFRRAAAYIDRIFKGAKPTDLPAEQPTKYDLVINLKTAKALGLTIPQSVLLRADRALD